MKRALQFLIPLTLFAALVVAGAWFFLSFRPDLTTSFCIDQARTSLSSGRSARAVRWYKRAWSLTPEDVQIAIELSRAYAQDGNYTKSEYTLVSAITKNPDNLSLYLELSRTYVAQDKLLDAEQMLSHTANDNIQRQLDELRPAAPVLSPESGKYSEIFDVSLHYAGGTACLAYDGDFPSMRRDLYSGPIRLAEGETRVVAVTVSDDGLVSAPAEATYIIGGIIEEVAFQDAFISRAVHEVLDKPANEPVMSNELWGLATLELPAETTDLSDILTCSSLLSLKLNDASGLDLTPLAKLTSLESLDLSGCTISTGALSAIASLPKLRELRLRGCALTDLSALSSLSSLEVLDISNNAISDLTSLQGMTSLRELYASTNTISSISALAPANQIELLDVSSNRLATLAPLDGKAALHTLIAPENKLTNLNALKNCTALARLDVSNNQITDLSPLAGLTDLATLLADHNQIEAIPDFSKAVSLNRVSLNYNQIPDLKGLGGLTYLNYVAVDYNNIRDLSPLYDCPTLVQVDAFANAVSDSVEPLTEKDVIVNYDPTFTLPDEETEDAEESEEA